MIKLNKITKSYDNDLIFSNFSLCIEENKITSILGPSGIGKTTLVNMLCNLTSYESGNIILPSDCKFSYVFQEPRLMEWLTVYQNIDIVLKKVYQKETREKVVKKYINMVGLDKYTNSKITSLSGGMKQRVTIARAFAYPSDILIMDEAFKGLDVVLEEELMDKFINLWNKDKRTVINITHSIEQSIQLSDNIIILNNKPATIVKLLNGEDINVNAINIIKSYI